MVTAEQSAIAATASRVQAGTRRPSLGAIWRALGEVHDPEIPVLSVLDLGLVRAVEWDAVDPTRLVVRLTTTYSGCPATALIAESVEQALQSLGIAAVRVETVYSPPWSSAWITREGERKLREYGIAPPGAAKASDAAAVDVAGISPLRRPGMVVACPRCGSNRTQLVAQFGSTSCKAHYRCTECLEPFEHFKTL